MNWLYQNIPFLCLILICLLDGRRIVTGARSFSHAYETGCPRKKKAAMPPARSAVSAWNGWAPRWS